MWIAYCIKLINKLIDCAIHHSFESITFKFRCNQTDDKLQLHQCEEINWTNSRYNNSKMISAFIIIQNICTDSSAAFTFHTEWNTLVKKETFPQNPRITNSHWVCTFFDWKKNTKTYLRVCQKRISISILLVLNWTKTLCDITRNNKTIYKMLWKWHNYTIDMQFGMTHEQSICPILNQRGSFSFLSKLGVSIGKFR